MFFDYKNFEYFITIKQLNCRQIRWIEFLIEFNFQINYWFETKNIKFDSLIRCFQNFLVDDFDERRQFNNQIIFKPKNLNVDVRNAIKLNEKIHQLKAATTKVAIITYFNIILFITIEISKQNFDDDNNNNNKKTIIHTFNFQLQSKNNRIYFLTSQTL